MDGTNPWGWRNSKRTEKEREGTAGKRERGATSKKRGTTEWGEAARQRWGGTSERGRERARVVGGWGPVAHTPDRITPDTTSSLLSSDPYIRHTSSRVNLNIVNLGVDPSAAS